jgi:flavin reductase (DIM6/NTAB) family NADH-FMN oxidoreductase RutF/pimeloyl-ACP methyl ester carboxylesterase
MMSEGDFDTLVISKWPMTVSGMRMDTVEFQGFGGVRLVGDAFGRPDDPAVLFLPTAGQSRAFWHGSARALAQAGRYAICVDLRGHGDSGHAADGRYDIDAHVADLKSILGELPSRAVVVAAGLGAIVAMATAGEAGTQLVSGLALVDATIWFDPDVSERLKHALELRTRDFSSREEALSAVAAMHPHEPAPAATDRILAAFAPTEDGGLRWRGDPRAVGGESLGAIEGRLNDAVPKIVGPVTLIRGSLNDAISAATLERLQAMIPGAETAEIEGAGHYAATDREDVFNAVLLDFIERRAPRAPLAYLGGSEPRMLRDALGCFGTGVTVVTTFDSTGEPIGLTANSFTSVSLDPPLILFSLARSSASLAEFEQAGRFAVNVLHIGQQPVAGRFARRDAPRFENVDWAVRAEGGSPILAGALASFDCRTYAVHDGGDHRIFIGEVGHAWFEPHRDPLLYFRGKYRRLHFS